MSIYEYNEEKVMQALREEAMEQGREEERKSREEAEKGREEERKSREEAEKGREEAEKLFSRQNILIKVLAEAGRTKDIVRVTEDEQYREQLFEEFGIA